MSITEIKQPKKEYGLIRTMPPHKNGEKNIKAMKAETKERYLKAMKEGTRLVKARFRNNSPHEADHEMIYKNFAGEDIQVWRFKHNETYDVPKGLVGHVNKNCKKTQNTLVRGSDGKPSVKIIQAQEFVSDNF